MFFFIRKKKWNDLEEKFDRLCNNVEECKSEINKLNENISNSLDNNNTLILSETENLSNLINEKIEYISTEINEEKDFIVAANNKQFKKQEKTIKKLEVSLESIVEKLMAMDMKEEEIIKLGQDISEQLLKLDESARLLLINTIMNEIPLEKGRG